MIRSKVHLIMAEKRLKVADVIRATGISKSTMHKIYNEQTSRIDFETIDKLCDFLGVGIGDLFEHQPNNKEQISKE